MTSATENQLGDAPIEPEYLETMQGLARALNQIFNGDAPIAERKTGFILLVFPFHDHGGRCNYISNGANRKDVVTMFREQIARFEGMPEQQGRA